MEWSEQDVRGNDGGVRIREEPMNPVFVSVGPVRLDDLSRANCSKCGLLMDTHQPDENLPDRLIGTCEHCKAWYLIDLEAGVMILLPDEGQLRGKN